MDTVSSVNRVSINVSPAILNPMEFKTKHTNISMRPTTWDSVNKILKIKGGTFNGLVSDLLENFVKENARYVHKFNEMLATVEE